MKNDAKKLAPSVQEAIRRKAVAAVHVGMSQTQPAELFGVAQKTVWMWLKAFRASAPEALRARKRGPKGEGTMLKGWQAATTANLIRDRDPEQLKLPFVFWRAGPCVN